ncbi:zinc finger protein [Reticulomyxa filosa]|uniref:Zinc finger protein n=1 Tax=Reticulomyxa filosa TaxID=46433 RepID=X6NBW5_RETFI|nr:zinc finger protein [Reticulomyxa filosa]|eukprot:ETO22817.1 zinc finger protein [Reticulomyxa filosa]
MRKVAAVTVVDFSFLFVCNSKLIKQFETSKQWLNKEKTKNLEENWNESGKKRETRMPVSEIETESTKTKPLSCKKNTADGNEDVEMISKNDYVLKSSAQLAVLLQSGDNSVKTTQLLETLSGPDMTCLQCQKSFKQRAHLQRHVKEQHLADEPDHVCTICHRATCVFMYTNLFALYIYLHIHIYIYIFFFFEQAFHQKANLMCHMLTHLKNRIYTHPFKCVLCEEHGLDRKFTRKSSLRRHVESKHPSCNRDAPWIVTQRKSRIITQLCDELHTRHLMEKYNAKKCFKESTSDSEISPPERSRDTNTTFLHPPSPIPHSTPHVHQVSHSQLSQIFPEIFLVQNPELLHQFMFSRDKQLSVELIQHNGNPSVPVLAPDNPSILPFIAQDGFMVKSENEPKR